MHGEPTQHQLKFEWECFKKRWQKCRWCCRCGLAVYEPLLLLRNVAYPPQDFQVFSVEISASYTTSGPNNNWHDDLKKAIR
jgi:hypothetical protein